MEEITFKILQALKNNTVVKEENMLKIGIFYLIRSKTDIFVLDNSTSSVFMIPNDSIYAERINSELDKIIKV